MLSKYKLEDVYVNEKQEVVMMYRITPREVKFIITPMEEAIKLNRHLNEIL